MEARVNAIQDSELVRAVHEYDEDSKLNTWKWEGLPEDISAELSPVVGDILTNCSACLDHIMFAFLNGKVDDREIYWPISKDPHRWSSAKGKIKDLPEWALEIVEDYQPSERRMHINPYPLLDLRRLVNIDKHRRLIILTLPIRGVGVPRELVEGPTSYNLDVAESGGVLASLAGEEIQANLDPHFFVGLGDEGRFKRSQVLGVIRPVISTVEEVLTKFEDSFQ